MAINKTLGASMRNLVFRFYSETAMLTLFALITGMLLAVFALPLFNNITGKTLSIGSLINFKFLGGIFLMWLGITVMSGSYPAMYLSRFSPKLVLQQSFQKENASAYIRKGLVVLQFACSVILIFGVIVIYQQMQYVRTKNLGFQPENLVAINATAATSRSQIIALMIDLKSQSNVLAVTRAQGFPGMETSGRSIYKNEDDKNGMTIESNHSQNGIVKVLHLKLLAGTDLPSVKAEGDSTVHIILNKKAVDYLGYTPEQAIGKKVKMQFGDNAYITGVVGNFNFASLHEPSGAYAFNDAPLESKPFFLVRFKTNNLPKTMEKFESGKLIGLFAGDFLFKPSLLKRTQR